MTNLLPCPFCGLPGEEQPDLARGDFAICCTDCACGTSLYDDPREAVAAWNRRALLPEEGQGLSPSQSQPGCDDSASRDASAGAEPSGAVLAVAEAWASIDGTLDKFRTDDGSDPTLGYRDGYLTDAASLIERIGSRGFVVEPRVPDGLSTPPATPALGLIEGEQGSSNAISGPTPKSADTTAQPSAADEFLANVAAVDWPDIDLDYLVTNTLYARGATSRQVKHDGVRAIRTLQAILRDARALSASPAVCESLGVSQDEPVIQSSSTAQEPKSESRNPTEGEF